ncbi:MAG TPA: Asp-tRNA(Asn)/Glu-tRNA(Gln) amidotransferase subunit GatA [Candidatus Lokiarchaeia archaeon]|nr:Asp-tRNA(Asn)/Glu-tRNA(Gln) amidotransferase subunit GatA [Candidatus Lokiarchaeia archaeon]
MANLYECTATELVDKLQTGETTPTELMAHYLERIENLEPQIHALTFVNKEAAMEAAKKAEKAMKKATAKKYKLLGLPLIVKDCISTDGLPTTCGSKILEGYIPPFDATVVSRLREAGAIIIGKSNMDEFAMGSSTERSCYGPTMNPWDLNKVPGGSSGGSGAAIAAREAPVALGSDTGGSIRCPAAYCGVSGIKPTYGRVSRYGLVAYANSLEQISPIAQTARDCAMMLEIMAGKDPLDSTSVDVSVDAYSDGLESLQGLKIGIPTEFFVEGLKDDVRKPIDAAIDVLRDFGATTMSVSLPSIKYSLPVYYLIAMCEASSNLARFDGLRYGKRVDVPKGNFDAVYSKTRQEGFGPEVRRRIILGTYALSAGYYDMYYVKALKARTLIQDEFKEALSYVDVMIGPTMPTTAFDIGTKVDDPLTMYLEDILTVPINLAGIPSLSVPVGFDDGGMPVGMQIMGNFFKEAQVLGIGMALEDKLQLYKKLPPVGA